MPLETRTRITLLLPVPTMYPLYLLVDQVLTDLILLCGGVTHSPDIPATFHGRWYDTNAHATKHDDLMLLLGDVHAPLRSQNLASFLDRLKHRCQRDFSQDIIWITVHEVQRVATDDYRK